MNIKNNWESLPLCFVLNLSFCRNRTVAVCRALGQMTVPDFSVLRPKEIMSFLGADVTNRNHSGLIGPGI